MPGCGVVREDLEADLTATSDPHLMLCCAESGSADTPTLPRLIELDVPYPPLPVLSARVRSEPEVPSDAVVDDDVEQQVASDGLTIWKGVVLLPNRKLFGFASGDTACDLIRHVGAP